MCVPFCLKHLSQLYRKPPFQAQFKGHPTEKASLDHSLSSTDPTLAALICTALAQAPTRSPYCLAGSLSGNRDLESKVDGFWSFASMSHHITGILLLNPSGLNDAFLRIHQLAGSATVPYGLCAHVPQTADPSAGFWFPAHSKPTANKEASQVVPGVKNLPAMQETQEMWVPSLGWEEPPEEEMATHCNILACEIPWTEEPGGLVHGGSRKEMDTTECPSRPTHRPQDEICAHPHLQRPPVPAPGRPPRLLSSPHT